MYAGLGQALGTKTIGVLYIVQPRRRALGVLVA